MIRLKDMKGDFYIYNIEDHSIFGRNTKQIYQLGDMLRIKVHKQMLRRVLGFFTSRMIHEKETTIILSLSYWTHSGGLLSRQQQESTNDRVFYGG